MRADDDCVRVCDRVHVRVCDWVCVQMAYAFIRRSGIRPREATPLHTLVLPRSQRDEPRQPGGATQRLLPRLPAARGARQEVGQAARG